MKENPQVILYMKYRVQTALDKHLGRLTKLPEWASRRNFSSVEELAETYKKRLEFEFNTIKNMGFCSYFLIVADGVEYCRKNSIPVGPGRGSASGCLCSFLLKITKIDPIRYNLLFERFLNPDRISMPDIDVDYSQERRHLVKEYFAQKYGSDRVASIGTFSRMKVRAAIKDIVRSLNLAGNTSESFKLADAIAKTLGEEDETDKEDLSFDEAMQNEKFREYMDRYPVVAHFAQKYEDVLRQMSMHAAGVLISSSPFDQELPMMVDKKGMVLTAYDGATVEKLGYLKLDTLGLKNLDVIETCKHNIKKIRGSLPAGGMSISGIPITPGEDLNSRRLRIEKDENQARKMASKAFELLRQGKTLGIFQCEQVVTQDLLRRGEANSIEDIADILAGIRPGPRRAGSTDLYISRKRGEQPYNEWYNYLIEETPQSTEDIEKVLRTEVADSDVNNFLDYYLTTRLVDDTFLSNAPRICSWLSRLENPEKTHFDLSYLAPVCDSTQGLPFFQEQLMQIATRCANFTKGESDTLRKGVGKKDAKIIKEIGAKFIEGMMRGGSELNPNGVSKREAQYIWYKFILPYGSYGFNLSHSIAYSFITYETAWLKANFPGEFYAALLSRESNQDKINTIITEARAHGIKFLPPNVNKSTDKFEIIDETTIIYALTCMKGVGEKAVAKIVAHRPFKNMLDFIGRAECNATTTKTLIKGGAFDLSFDLERINRKNYFDFFEDARTKLKRQTERLLKQALLKQFNLSPPRYSSEEKEKAVADGTYLTPAKWFDNLIETPGEFQTAWQEGVAQELATFTYDWTNPVTVSSKGEAYLVERESDSRETWTQDEIFQFEEEIFGVAISGHRLDPYLQYEQAFIKNTTSSGLPAHKLADSLDNLTPGAEVFIFAQILQMTSKTPYAKNKVKFTRRFSIEDRTGKAQITAFDNTYESSHNKEVELQRSQKAISSLSMLDSKFLTRLDKKLSTRPVAILKCKVNEYNNRKSLLLQDVVDWINRAEILDKIEQIKQDELNVE